MIWPAGGCNEWEQYSQDGSKIGSAPTGLRTLGTQELVIIEGQHGILQLLAGAATAPVGSAKARMAPAIIGAVAVVIAAVLGAFLAGRSGTVERQKFRREIRAPIYGEFIEKAQGSWQRAIGNTLQSGEGGN